MDRVCRSCSGRTVRQMTDKPGVTLGDRGSTSPYDQIMSKLIGTVMGSEPSGNVMLNSLNIKDKRAVVDQSQLVDLRYQEVLFEEAEPLAYLWFPITAVFSLMTVMNDGQAIEITTIGNEGVLGLAGLFGEQAIARAVVQVAGKAYKMPLAQFRQLLPVSPSLKQAIDAFTHLFLYQIVKTAGCNALHSVEGRCARWLLAMHDRQGGGSAPYEMTQEFLAEMLACRRQTVTMIAQKLQKEHLIDYRYGLMKILNRPGLEAVACECHRKINTERQRILALPMAA
jgi:CRP-like cAMP-binding protein